MNYNGFFCLLLVGIVQAQERLNKLETPYDYLMNNVNRESQTLSLNVENPPNNVNINFRRNPRSMMLSELEKLRYDVDQTSEAQTSLGQMIAALYINEEQSLLDMEKKISKQIENAFSTQKDVLKQILDENTKVPALTQQTEFDEHLNWSGKSSYADCTEALNENQQKSEVYILDPKIAELQPFGVYCKFEDGKAWTIIQRRQDGSVDFYRNWDDYKNGFGDLNGEYWLGLERIHELTNRRKYELWFQMETYKGEVRSFKYESFSIDNAEQAYRLKVEGFSGEIPTLNINYNNGESFTTFDRDNDHSTAVNCAKNRKGAFWHDNCTYCNPNGEYKEGNDAKGIYCGHWHEPMKYFHMAMRPVE